MKPLVMNKEAETMLFKHFAAKFFKELEDYKMNPDKDKFTMTFDMSVPVEEKVTILFTQKAYLRMLMLVDYFDTEVGWYGLVEKLDDKLYRVYDVKVCKQSVNGSKVDTEDEDTLEFFNSLTDDEAEHMHFQAHSHVRMPTTASGVDTQNQLDVVRNMGKSGFYIFQIWNKSGDISTYMYDVDNNAFYDKKDVIIEIEDGDSTITEFLEECQEKVVEQKIYPYEQKNKKGKKGKDNYTPANYNYGGYYGNGYYQYPDDY